MGKVLEYNDVTQKVGASRLVTTSMGKIVVTSWQFGLDRVVKRIDDLLAVDYPLEYRDVGNNPEFLEAVKQNRGGAYYPEQVTSILFNHITILFLILLLVLIFLIAIPLQFQLYED